MDVTWADWSAYMQEDENGNKSRPLGGAPSDTDIDDTYAVRFGTEYLIFRQKVIVPVRGGLFMTRVLRWMTPQTFTVLAWEAVLHLKDSVLMAHINSGGQTILTGKTSVCQEPVLI